MGKKKIALVDLSQSETAQLKASGVRSQKLIIKKSTKTPDVAIPVVEPQGSTLMESPEGSKIEKKSNLTGKTRVKHSHSKRYLTAKNLIDKAFNYPVEKAVKLLRQISTAKFDATVEMHLKLAVDKLAGEINLPHGSGKTVTVAIATDIILGKIKDGIIDFDILVAEPKMMPKLAQYAKLLGPKGLMPNPKTGTISDKPEELKKKLEGGALRYKSEPKAPLIHLTVGKLSFKDDQLSANINTVIKTILPKNIISAHICSSMSPSIKIDIPR